MKVKNQWAEHQPFAFWGRGWDETRIFPAAGGIIITSFVGAAVVDGSTTGNWPMLFLPVNLIVWLFVIFGYRFSGLTGIDNNSGRVGTSRYDYYCHGEGSRDLLRKVLKLSKKDQQLFPPDLPRTLSQNLMPNERRKINQEIYDILKKIADRDKYLAEVEMKAIPTEHILAALNAAKENIDSDIKVYKDYL